MNFEGDPRTFQRFGQAGIAGKDDIVVNPNRSCYYLAIEAEMPYAVNKSSWPLYLPL